VKQKLDHDDPKRYRVTCEDYKASRLGLFKGGWSAVG